MWQIGKKLVNSDYKNGRVKNPTIISEKQEKQVRKYVKDFFDKAVEKDKERRKRRADRKIREGEGHKSPMDGGVLGDKQDNDTAKSEEDRDIAISDDEEEKPPVDSTTPATPLDQLSLEGLKRKRDQLLEEEEMGIEDQSTPNKLIKSETPPPPPPPPAPVDGVYPDIQMSTEAVVEDPVDTPTDACSTTMDDSMTRPSLPSATKLANGTSTNMLSGSEDNGQRVDGGEQEVNGEDHETNGESHGVSRPVHA